jgi:predicted secreted acid phosphatase
VGIVGLVPEISKNIVKIIDYGSVLHKKYIFIKNPLYGISEEKIYKRMDTLDEQMKEVMQSTKEMGNEISKPTTPTGEVVE